MNNYCEACNKELKTKEYCATCGAYNTGRKTTLYTLLNDGVSQIVSIERGVLQTILATFKTPHRVVFSYYEGYRNRFASPSRILLFTLIILGLVYYFQSSTSMIDVKVNEEEELIDPLTQLKITLLLMIPLFSLTSKIVFLKQSKSWLIHLISMIYLLVPRLLIFVFLILIIESFFENNILNLVLLFILLLSVFTTNTRVFIPKANFTKALLFGFIQFVVFIFLTLTLLLFTSLIVSEFSFSFFT
jgi:hypothetical protein